MGSRTKGTSTALVSSGNVEQRMDPQSRRKRELESCRTDDFVHLKRADIAWQQVAGGCTKWDVQSVSWNFTKVRFHVTTLILQLARSIGGNSVCSSSESAGREHQIYHSWTLEDKKWRS